MESIKKEEFDNQIKALIRATRENERLVILTNVIEYLAIHSKDKLTYKQLKEIIDK